MPTLKILGCDYTVIEKPVAELGKRGFFNGERQTLEVAAEMPQQAKEATVLHEVIHALDFMMSIGLSEKQVKRLEHGLYQVLTANGISLNSLLKPNAPNLENS